MEMATLISLLLSAAAFVAVLWQIARTEGLQPIDGAVMARGVVQETDEYIDLFVSVRPTGGVEMYEAEMVVWGGRVVNGFPPVRPILRADFDPMWAIIRVPKGKQVKAGLAWIESSHIRHHPVRRCVRRDLLGDSETWERWKWCFWADPRPGREHGRGYWVKPDRQWGRDRCVPQPEHQPVAEVVPAEEIHTVFLRDLFESAPQPGPSGHHDEA